MGEANSGKIRLKLLVDRNANRVIFSEAGKEFVDFLFNLLTLPVGTVVKLLSKDKTTGSLGKIYESIEAMHANYMVSKSNKEHVLNPKVSSCSRADSKPLLSYKTYDEPNDYVFYNCGRATYNANCIYSSHLHMSRNPNALCPTCNCQMNKQMTYPKSAAEVEKALGYVNELVTYLVMDNLEVKPLLSTISSITLLKDLASLETVEVFIGKEEAVDLLRASFLTDKVLTSLFLNENNKAIKA